MVVLHHGSDHVEGHERGQSRRPQPIVSQRETPDLVRILDELAVVRAFRVGDLRAVRHGEHRERATHDSVLTLVERQYLHDDVRFRSGPHQPRQLLLHRLLAADRAHDARELAESEIVKTRFALGENLDGG